MSDDSKADPAEVAANMRKLLEAIRSGELSASAGTAARIEGVILALESLTASPE